MLGWLFYGINILMCAEIVRWRTQKWGMRVFWAIQALQLLETPLLYHRGFTFLDWVTLEFANLFPEALCVVLLWRYSKLCFGALLLHLYIKSLHLASVDTAADYFYDALYLLQQWLDRALILLLLVYPHRRAILRLWRKYVSARTRQEEAPNGRGTEEAYRPAYE